MSEQMFWKRKKLGKMSPEEWESLCDGCGICCMEKLEDEDTGKIYHTTVACRYLDIKTCLCETYETRLEKCPGCTPITVKNLSKMSWLPKTCAYRLVAEGKKLKPWHPLLSGSLETVHEKGISVMNKAIPGQMIAPADLEDYII